MADCERTDKGKREDPRMIAEASDKRRVFVVHGRNMEARDAMFTFLRAIDLDPIEWEEAIAMTGEGTPYIGDAIDIAFTNAQAAVILLTGDDMARLGRRYLLDHDPSDEKHLTRQARPNVLFEMGMAFGKYPHRTVIVSLGPTRQFSDIVGRHVIHLSNKAESRKKIADRLKNAKCLVRTDNRSDWLNAGDFDSARHNPDVPEGPNPFRLRLVNRRATFDGTAQYERKVWFQIRNDSDDCLEIRHSRWKAGSGGIKANIVPSTLQVKLGTTWCPEKQGIELMHLPAGDSIQTWIDPAAEYTPKDLDYRCQAEASVGSLILLVNGIEVEVVV
jgi:predicted nucleotide-binding protein